MTIKTANYMSKYHYTDERNVQIVISLLKAHGIKRVIASPGTTNMTFVVSIENDPWFQIWSSVDERSAAYMACGMVAETGEPVVLSCTGATASRNYMPGLTEAYYRKLPVLAITSTRGNHKLGHLIDQQIDRRISPNDIAIEKVTIPMVKDAEDEKTCTTEANKAMLALKLNGGGPVLINMYTRYSHSFSTTEIAPVKVISRHTIHDQQWPELPKDGHIIVSIGSHSNFTEAQTKAIDGFCSTHNALVCCDHTSGYRGKYEVHPQLICAQRHWRSSLSNATLRIHIGEVSGDQFIMNAKDTWRVSPDGCIRDTFGTLSRVFMMPEQNFFEHYTDISAKPQHSYYDAVNKEIHSVANHMQELPFSNIWIAQQMSGRLPNNCELHFGIYHSLRSWNFFKLPPNILAKCNVGGFGIDGGMSSMIGASLASPEKTFIGVFGDLAFFYDMNVVGNRHVGNNVRILLINNGKGNEFRNYNHPCSFLGDEADEYIAAAHHFGDKSPKLVRDYATDLGYKYLTASNKAQFMESLDSFLSEDKSDTPMIFEVFTETQNESLALEMTLNTMSTIMEKIKETIKNGVKDAVGASRVDSIKKIISKL